MTAPAACPGSPSPTCLTPVACPLPLQSGQTMGPMATAAAASDGQSQGAAPASARPVDELLYENEALKRRLAQLEAIITRGGFKPH